MADNIKNEDVVDEARRDTVTFFRSFYEAIQQLPEADRLPVYEAICEYCLNNVEIELSGTPSAVFTLIKPILDKSKQKSESGSKGGKRTASKREANNKQTSSKHQADGKQTASQKEKEKEKEKDIGVGREDNGESDTSPPAAEPPPSPKKKKPSFHSYGEYKRVRLTDEQYNKLVSDFGETITADYIKRCDEYIQQTGKKYKDHNLTIRKWIGKDEPKPKDRGNSSFSAEDVEKLVAARYSHL